ncbi:hypothetical protein F5887DRAFT_937406 [Amanita rubescens]|nr:hypothetical protein F5887DRAFT_937406 [Amanita rubescens]
MEDGSIPHDSIAEAAARRIQELTPQAPPAQLIKEHDRRQKFRRLIDPGITRPNSKEQATSSLNTLLKIAENLKREPSNPKFQRFKTTNTYIKRDLVNPKGALEYAVEMGFRPQVEDFQPYYAHDPRHMEELEIGLIILKEFLDQESGKAERAKHALKDKKAADEAAALKVHDKLSCHLFFSLITCFFKR